MEERLKMKTAENKEHSCMQIEDNQISGNSDKLTVKRRNIYGSINTYTQKKNQNTRRRRIKLQAVRLNQKRRQGRKKI